MFGSLAYKLRGPLHTLCYLSEYRYFSEGVVEGGGEGGVVWIHSLPSDL